MIRVNLIPVVRRQALKARTHLRWWITACVGYAVFLVIATLVAHVVGARDDRSLRLDVARTEVDIETAEEQVVDLRGEFARVSSMVRANRAVGTQPDWSVLLALLAETTGEEVVLRDVRVESRGPRAPSRPTPPAVGTAGDDGGPMVLGIVGLGRSQNAVSRFVLQVEQLPLLQQVKLLDTMREPFFEDHAIAFRLECVLAPEEGSLP